VNTVDELRVLHGFHGEDDTTPPARYSLPILTYHQVSPHARSNFRKYCIHPREFRGQMVLLKRLGYTGIAPEFLGAGLPHPNRNRKPLWLTFDDGFEDCFLHALPVLRDAGFTATFYVVAGLIGGSSRWLRRERSFELPIMNWSQLRALESEGFRCESHTLTHPRLSELTPRQCRQELEGSRKLLEDGLGREVRHLAYPFGSVNETVRTLAAEAGYLTACTTRIGIRAPGDDNLLLPRVTVSGLESSADFLCRVRTGRTLRESLAAPAAAVLRKLRLR
jgi:peptidoglycan/xylan/chitin deacetylase (PgdA/CDA1 family)